MFRLRSGKLREIEPSNSAPAPTNVTLATDNAAPASAHPAAPSNSATSNAAPSNDVMDGLLNVSDDEDSLKSDLDGESVADGKGSLKSNSFDQAGVDGDGDGQEEWTAMAPSL